MNKIIKLSHFNKKYLILLPIICVTFIGCKYYKKEISVKRVQESDIAKITIFIHGTNAFPITNLFQKFIYGPAGISQIMSLNHDCFIHFALQSISENDPVEFPIDSFFTYVWSGKLSSKAREEAALILYNEINKIIETYKNKKIQITLITHSHGGNVALNLAKVCESENFKIDKLILLACPVQEETKEFAKNKIFKKVYNIYSLMDSLQVLDPQGIKNRNRGKNCPIFSQRRFELTENIKQTKVKIDNRSLMHVEFILPKFLKHLPALIKEMDKLDCQAKYLIKIDKKNELKAIQEY